MCWVTLNKFLKNSRVLEEFLKYFFYLEEFLKYSMDAYIIEFFFVRVMLQKMWKLQYEDAKQLKAGFFLGASRGFQLNIWRYQRHYRGPQGVSGCSRWSLGCFRESRAFHGVLGLPLLKPFGNPFYGLPGTPSRSHLKSPGERSFWPVLAKQVSSSNR